MPSHETMDPVARFLASRSDADFRDAVRETRPYVFQTAYRVLSDWHLASDVTSEVFATLHAGRIDPSECRDGLALLASLALNGALNRLRHERRLQKRQERFVLSRRRSEVLGEGEEGVSVEVRWAIHDAIEALPEHLRETIELRFYGSLSVEEIAWQRGIPQSTAEKHLTRAFRVLRRRLEPAVFSAVSAILLHGSLEGMGIENGLAGGTPLPRSKSPAGAGGPVLAILAALGLLRASPVLKSLAAAAVLMGVVTMGLLWVRQAPIVAHVPAPAVSAAPAPRAPGPIARAKRVAPAARPAPAAIEPLPVAPAPPERAASLGPYSSPLAAFLPPELASSSAPFAIITVLDEDGKLVREGKVTFHLHALRADASPDLQDAFALSVLNSLGRENAIPSLSLAEANPVTACWIPPAFWGVTLDVVPLVRDQLHTTLGTFTVRKNETADITLDRKSVV